jgi:hypothetical protein
LPLMLRLSGHRDHVALGPAETALGPRVGAAGGLRPRASDSESRARRALALAARRPLPDSTSGTGRLAACQSAIRVRVAGWW